MALHAENGARTELDVVISIDGISNFQPNGPNPVRVEQRSTNSAGLGLFRLKRLNFRQLN
jgi:hypothetical protein